MTVSDTSDFSDFSNNHSHTSHMEGLDDGALTEALQFNSHSPSPVPDERRFTTTVGLINAFLFQ